jgi:nucleotide-binding universal stress UspA family protein
MGSHGRSGVSKLLLGSQTQKVLAAANVPVVVIR